MKSLLLKILLLVLAALPVYGIDITNFDVCEYPAYTNCRQLPAGSDLIRNEFDPEKTVSLRAKFNSASLCKTDDCWIYLGEIADTGTVFVNKIKIASFRSDTEDYYIRSHSILLPLTSNILKPETNEIEIIVKELNQNIFGLKNDSIKIGNYKLLHQKSFFDWIMRTGSSLVSGFSILILLLGLLSTLIFLKDSKIIFLTAYSVSALLYLISFSEIPREYINPIFASGTIHFTTRITQDLFLFLVIHSFFGKKSFKFVSAIIFLYITNIGWYWYEYFWGDPSWYRAAYIVKISAILIMFPFLYGFFVTRKSDDPYGENFDMNKVFGVMSLVQIYDLAIFYGFIRSTFVIKWYLPPLILLFVFLYIRRKIIENKKTTLLASIGELATQVAHDIRSPAMALEAVAQSNDMVMDPKSKKLIQNASKRINDIANNLISNYKFNLTQFQFADVPALSVNLNKIIENIIEEKKITVSSKNEIFFKAKEIFQTPSAINIIEFERIFSNILNNSLESMNKERGIIDVNLYRKNSSIQVVVRDNGQGISENLLSKVFEKGVTGKTSGTGLGLAHAKEYLQSIGGDITIYSEPNAQTTVVMTIPT